MVLTRIQFDLLLAMARRPRMVFTRAQLLETLWEQSFTETRHVDTVAVMVNQHPSARLATRLALSQMLVILLVVGITGAVLLSQTRRYFEAADQRALSVQAQFAASTCDDTCLAGGISQTNVSSSQFPPAANAVQSQLNSSSNLRVKNVDPANQGQVTASLVSRLRVVRIQDGAAEIPYFARHRNRQTAGTL
jgi:Transcriptional regulatory protein, C terminal